MATFDKQKVQVAVANHSKFDLSSTHITTANFMQYLPVYYRHMIPGETIKGSSNVLARLSPVAVPTYGRCRINLRSFFVPFRTIFPQFNDFISDTIASNYSNSSLVANSPVVANQTLCQFVNVGYYNGLPLSQVINPYNTGDPYDYFYAGAHYKLTYYGRIFVKIIESLGYKLVWSSKDDFNYSALPLLAYLRIYADWYSNTAYADSMTYLYAMRLFSFNDPTSNLQLTFADLGVFFNFVCKVCYDNGNDVFLNAWDNPVAPNTNMFSSMSMVDQTLNVAAGSVVTSANGTPVMVQNAATDVTIGTDYLHTLLKSMTDYVKRNQLSGARAIDRYLARFGLNLDSSKVNRSIYINSQSVDVDFGSVTQTVNTAGAGQDSNLGDYAGQGLGRGQLDFDYKTDEFGMFIVISTIMPAASLYQGFDRNNLHIDKTDFFTPEFDQLGVQVIDKGEVYVSPNDTFSSGNAAPYLGSFGYAPRYYEYKFKRDYVTGDFTSPFGIAGGDSWHLSRILADGNFNDTITDLHHGIDFTRGIDSEQYNRIFNYTKDDIDMFYLVYHFAVTSLCPCKSLFDTYDFENAGHSLEMSPQGARVN